MTQHSLHTLGSSLQGLPVAMIFTKQILLTQKSSVTVITRADDGATESLKVRATKLTALLKGICGTHYSQRGEAVD
jgi:hypothetical protein